MKFFKKSNGITLVALVITIIILLILAGIAISQLTGSGLFNNAKQAGEKYDNARAYEDDEIQKTSNLVEAYLNNSIIYAESVSFTPTNTNWKVKTVKEALDYLYNN